MQEQPGEVFSQTFPGTSFPRVENQGEYKLKAWPRRRSRPLRTVVDTVRYFRCGVGSGFAPSNPGAENFQEGDENNSETNRKDKCKSPSVNSKWRKFGFLRERRQRSASESRLSELYAPSDEMDPATWRANNVRRRSKSGPKATVRRISSATVTDSNRHRSFENVFQSLPNSPSSTFMNRNHHRSNSRSNTSRSTNSQGSTPTSNESCPACTLAPATETQNGGQLLSTELASTFPERSII